MVAEPITYDTSFFARMLGNKVYRTKNVIALNRCLEDIHSEDDQWVKLDDNGEAMGVVDETEKPSLINNIATNYLAMTFILNRLNEMLRFCARKNRHTIQNDEGKEISTAQVDFLKNHIHNKEGFEVELERFYNLLHFFRDQVLRPGSKTHRDVMAVLNKTVKVANQEQNLFIKNIQQFFPQSTDINPTKTFGDIHDAKSGVDLEFIYRGNHITVQVHGADRLEREGEYYKVFCEFNPQVQHKADYFAFVLLNNYIYVFENDKTKIRTLSGNTLFDRTSNKGLSYLFHRDTLKDYKKVF